MVESAEVVWVFGFVLLDICLVYPQEGIHEPATFSTTYQNLLQNLHPIQRRRHISHHGHEEEGHLENCVLEKVEAADHAVIPCRMVHIDEQRCEP